MRSTVASMKSCLANRVGGAAARLCRYIRHLVIAIPLLACEEMADGDPVNPSLLAPLETCLLEFEATAYCDTGITKSGAPVAPGIVAADPSVLPLGSLIRLEDTDYQGIYEVLDTGGLVIGPIIDIYMPDLEEALAFGRRKVRITVLRYGHKWTVRRSPPAQPSPAD